ncbi:MAG: alpha/beta fold hydrolase [Clostridia bacterium]|nr:alpha/beta fold hydrolase [Clostridia bacterium]
MKHLIKIVALLGLGILAALPVARAETTKTPVRSETLVLEGEDQRIEGILYLPDNSAESYPTVILCHGFGGNYHFLTERIAQELARNGYAAYAFNFRNPDTRSMLNTSPLTEAKTLNIVIDQIKEQSFADPSRLFLLGESQGGFVSAYVDAQRAVQMDDIRALILYYPAFVLQDDARARNPHYQEEGYLFPETETIMANQISGMYSRDALSFDIYEVISGYQQDVLIIHGTADTVVPLSYSERALEVYPHAELKIIPNAGHGFYGGDDFDTAVKESVTFLNSHSEVDK